MNEKSEYCSLMYPKCTSNKLQKFPLMICQWEFL